MKTNARFLLRIAKFYLECEMFQIEIVEKSKHVFYVQQLFLFSEKSRCL